MTSPSFYVLFQQDSPNILFYLEDVKSELNLPHNGDRLTSTERRTLLKRIIESGFQITPEALDFILNQENPNEVVDTLFRTASDAPSAILSREHIESLLGDSSLSESVAVPGLTTYLVEEPATEPQSLQDEDTEWPVSVIKTPAYRSVGSAGSVEDFFFLFKDRFRRIRQIYMSRIDTQNAVKIATAKDRGVSLPRRKAVGASGARIQRPPSQMVIGMVRSKSISASRNIILEIEDFRDSLTCIIPSNREDFAGRELSVKGNSILLDEVVCLSGYVDVITQDSNMMDDVAQRYRLIADNVIFPDIPTAREIGRAKRDVYALFISDLHIGSKEFLGDEFEQFIRWVRGEDVDSSEREIVNHIRYLVIAGDLVDGIGVYPDQKGDLVIPDIYDQYAHLATLLTRLPESIKIICIPGNHDACRQALPKPPIPEEFAKPLYDFGDRILMLGDPSHILLEGTNLLITHGDSMDDLVTNLPGASYKDPAFSMKELLKRRHLAPLYGGKTELAPLERDWMVIDTPPDIVHFGHAHHNSVDNYRGVQIVNSGTFQSQTEFMRKQGVDPTPGIVTYINLRTGAPGLKMFYDFSTHS
jgi:DNA polymerase II small subunit